MEHVKNKQHSRLMKMKLNNRVEGTESTHVAKIQMASSHNS